MNIRQLKELDALRALRERRAARQWAVQQQACAAASEAAEAAGRAEADHQNLAAEQARQLVSRLESGLPVNVWQHAHARLAAMAEEGEALLAQFRAAASELERAQAQERALREAWLGQRRRTESSSQLLAKHGATEALCQARLEDDETATTPRVHL